MTAPHRRLSQGVFAALAVLILAAVLGDARPAAAQGYGWFGNLFGGGTPQRSAQPAYPGGYGAGTDESDQHYYKPRRAARRHRPADQPAQDAAVSAKPKAPGKTPTVFVDVFGDSLGQMLAGGLDEALADRDDVAVVHKAKGSTGLVNTAYYDWRKTIDDLLGAKKDAAVVKDGDAKKDAAKAEGTKKDATKKDDAAKADDAGPKDAASKDPAEKKERIDVAVMMIGVNDRQPIVQDGKTLKPGSPEWTAVYRQRVMAIDEAFARKKIPLVWVGVPITKDDDFADDMAALNDIYRDAAAKTGATYVDTWEPFSDDNGDFAAYGPDVNGQTMRLRSSDGIHFTKAGARKLAHFVEAPVRHDLDGKTPLPTLPTAEAPADAKTTGKADAGKKDGKPAVAIVKPDAGPIRNLGELPAAKGGELAQVPSFAHEKPDDVVENASARGDAAPAGRADNFRWPSDKAPTGR